MKVKMYLLSMIFLFIPLIFYFSGIDDFSSVLFDTYKSVGFSNLILFFNKLHDGLEISWPRVVVCSSLALTACYTYFWYRSELSRLDKKDSSTLVFVRECSQESTEYLSFLSTYIMPLAFTDLSKTSNVISFIFILVIVGFLHIKTKRIHSNPTLSLFGVSAYKIKYFTVVDGKSRDGDSVDIIVLSKDKISIGDSIRIISKSGYLRFAKKIED